MDPTTRLAVLHTNLTEFITAAPPKLKPTVPLKKPIAKLAGVGAVDKERIAARARARGYSLEWLARRTTELAKK